MPALKISRVGTVAVIGAGDFGAAIAHALAQRGRVDEITLIDDQTAIAAGKALDIQQSGPIDHFETRLKGSSDPLSAVGAGVIVIADPIGKDEWQGETGLTLVRRLVEAGTRAPIVFAGARQTPLMEVVARELKVPIERLAGSAAAALVGAARALVALELKGSAVDIQLTVSGRPPAVVIGWSSATINGSLIADRVPAHRLLATTQTLSRLWPLGPQAIAAATVPIVEAFLHGSRSLIPGVAILDGEFSLRGVAALLSLEIGRGRITRRVAPTLSPQEQVELVTKLSR